MSNLLRFPAVQDKTGGLSRTTIWRLEREGCFPKRRVITPHTVAWNEDEIDAWIQSRNEGVVRVPGTRKTDIVVGTPQIGENGGNRKHPA